MNEEVKGSAFCIFSFHIWIMAESFACHDVSCKVTVDFLFSLAMGVEITVAHGCIPSISYIFAAFALLSYLELFLKY